MLKTRSDSPVLFLGFVALALVALSLSVPPDSRIAVPALAVVLLALTVGLARLQRPPEAARFLVALLLLGLGVRFLTLAVIYRTTGTFVFAPDAGDYESLGLRLARFWSGEVPSPPAASDLGGYARFNGLLFYLLGDARAAPNLINAFLGVWAAVPAYHLARRLVPDVERVARTAAVLVAFFPSLVLWSVLNVREAPTILAIVAAVYFVDRLRDSPVLPSLLGAGLALAVLAASRQYMMAVVGVSAGLGLLLARTHRPARSLAVGVLVIGAVIVVVQSSGLGGPLLDDPSLPNLELYRQDLALGAASSYGAGYDISTPVGAIGFLPVGLVHFLFAPFPWSVDSFLQLMTVPESVLWYLLVPFAVWGAILALRHRPGATTVVLSVAVAATISYALVEGNVGTAYRHRAQVLPLAFVLCAVGLSDAWALWVRR